MSRLAELKADYEALGKLLAKAEGSGAAAIVRERRILRELLEQNEVEEGETPLVDELAERRKSKAEPVKKAAKKKARKSTKKAAKKRGASKRAVPPPPPARRGQSRRSG